MTYQVMGHLLYDLY